MIVSLLIAALIHASAPPPSVEPLPDPGWAPSSRDSAGLRVIVTRMSGHSDTFRVRRPRIHRRPALPGRILPYSGSGGSQVDTRTRADTSSILFFTEEGPNTTRVSLTTLAPGAYDWSTPLPAEDPDTLRPAPGERCSAVTAFFVEGVGTRPVAPVVLVHREGPNEARLRVDPRRHRLRMRPALTVRADSLAGPIRSVTTLFHPGANALILALHRDRDGRLRASDMAKERHAWTPNGRVSDGEWTFYLLDDRPHLRSPCRRVPDPPPAEPPRRDPMRDYMRERIASAVDTPPAAYALPSLAGTRLPRGTREIRFTTGGGMLYDTEHVVRIVERRGRVRGEIYEWWGRIPGKAYAGGPFNREKSAPSSWGCLSPRISAERWVCRTDRTIPVDWGRVLARLDSLGVDALPAQPSSHDWATDRGHVIIEARRGARYNGVYHYGPNRRVPAEAGAAAVGALLGEILRGDWNVPPDSRVRFREVARGEISVPDGVLMVVRDEATWKSLWRRYAATTPEGTAARARRRAPPADFRREHLLLIGNGTYKRCAPPADHVRRVESRGDTLIAVVGDPPKGARFRAGRACGKERSPVQVVAIPRRPGQHLAFYSDRERYWPPEYPVGLDPRTGP